MAYAQCAPQVSILDFNYAEVLFIKKVKKVVNVWVNYNQATDSTKRASQYDDRI